MGIYLPNMEMPTNCCQCPVNMEICKRGYKYLLEHTELYDKRADDCPLVPVPPHGRLIDVDAFIKENEYFADRDFNNPRYDTTLRELVGTAPTIIPAEEGET